MIRAATMYSLKGTAKLNGIGLRAEKIVLPALQSAHHLVRQRAVRRPSVHRLVGGLNGTITIGG